MKLETLLELVQEIEKEDPTDFAGLPFDGHDLRQLACMNVLDIINKLPQSSIEENMLLMAATVTRLVLENMVLQARLAILMQEEQ